MKFTPIFLAIALMAAFFCCTGCGGGSSNPAGPAAPVETVELKGSLAFPNTVNSGLLPAVTLIPGSNLEVRNAIASAAFSVNGIPISSPQVTYVAPTWDISLQGVQKITTGSYKVLLTMGKIRFQSWVKSSGIGSFTIDSQTTAAALLADKSGMDANELLASFPALVGKVKTRFQSAILQDLAQVPGLVENSEVMEAELASQTKILKENTNFDPTAMVAYLGLTNDLDGDGEIDLRILQNISGDRVRFLTTLSSQTSMLDPIPCLASYPDAQLLSDFRNGAVSTTRTFSNTAEQVALGLFFKKSAAADIYLKLFIKRIDIVEGSFKGVLVEYRFVEAPSTALATGTKVLTLRGILPAEGTASCTDFIIDGGTQSDDLCFLGSIPGLGSSNQNTRILRGIDGKPALKDLSYAETYQTNGANHFTSTALALAAMHKERGIEAGDVFSVYFPSSRHYGLIKITAVSTSTVTMDYVINSAIDEPRF